jgi:hypothetical protein
MWETFHENPGSSSKKLLRLVLFVYQARSPKDFGGGDPLRHHPHRFLKIYSQRSKPFRNGSRQILANKHPRLGGTPAVLPKWGELERIKPMSQFEEQYPDAASEPGAKPNGGGGSVTPAKPSNSATPSNEDSSQPMSESGREGMDRSDELDVRFTNWLHRSSSEHRAVAMSYRCGGGEISEFYEEEDGTVIVCGRCMSLMTRRTALS